MTVTARRAALSSPFQICSASYRKNSYQHLLTPPWGAALVYKGEYRGRTRFGRGHIPSWADGQSLPVFQPQTRISITYFSCQGPQGWGRQLPPLKNDVAAGLTRGGGL